MKRKIAPSHIRLFLFPLCRAVTRRRHFPGRVGESNRESNRTLKLRKISRILLSRVWRPRRKKDGKREEEEKQISLPARENNETISRQRIHLGVCVRCTYVPRNLGFLLALPESICTEEIPGELRYRDDVVAMRYIIKSSCIPERDALLPRRAVNFCTSRNNIYNRVFLANTKR